MENDRQAGATTTAPTTETDDITTALRRAARKVKDPAARRWLLRLLSQGETAERSLVAVASKDTS